MSVHISIIPQGTSLSPIDPYPVEPVQYFMQREDREVFGSVRSCAPCPAIMILKSDSHASVSQQHQYALRAANYNMELVDVQKILHYRLAFANFTGFGDDTDPRADYFFNKNLSSKLPNWDKVRTTSRSLMTGTKQYSLVQGLKETVALITSSTSSLLRRRKTFASLRSEVATALTSVNVLKVKVFDSRLPPPLRPGKSYPKDIDEVEPTAYAMMPWDNPEMWMVATVVKANGDVYQFPRGGLYPWIDNGSTPYTFVPHMANLGYGDILYPLKYVYEVPLGSKPPRAYTI